MIEFDSFWNIWFWLTVVVSWSMTCHWTIGVPFDMIVLANRHGGQWADECEAVTQANISRMCYYVSRGGVIFVLIVTFCLAVLATFGFYFGMEFATALFLLLAPMVAVQFLGAGLAIKCKRNNWHGEVLRKAVARRRFWNQVIGVSSVFFLSIFAAIQGVQNDNFIIY